MSTPEIVAVRCLKDNYAWLLHANNETVLIDAPEAAPILDALKSRGWALSAIALTHHHGDHIDAVPELVSATSAKVIGARADAYRLPPLDIACAPGDDIVLAGLATKVIDVSGHTLGHIAFHVAPAQAVFTGDSLMALGCGRLFEGTPAVMWDSLQRLDALPPETLVCSGHDYCVSNGAFALTVDPENADLRARIADTAAAARPCAPATLADERRTNPFLRAAKLAPAMGAESAAKAFATLRAMKDAA